jgi:hypothetical protein
MRRHPQSRYAKPRRLATPGGSYSFEVSTTTATGSTAFKEQIRDQISVERPLPAGGGAPPLAFLVGPRRAGPNLGKATIDSLASVLGRDAGAEHGMYATVV